MDYKFIILLIVLLGVILFITKEIDNLKKDNENKTNNILISIENNSKMIRNKMQNDIGVCIGKIKSLNGEYIEQVRKMNDYGSQPITNMSNHYTDSETLDGNGKKKNPINYLSDVYDENKNTQNEPSLYMSEDVPNNNSSKHIKIHTQKKSSATSSSSKKSEAMKFKVAYPEKSASEKNILTVKSSKDSDESNSSKQSSKESSSSEKESSNGVKINEKQNSSGSSESSESSKSFSKLEESSESSESSDSSDSEDSEDSEESSLHSSKYGSITLGSKKNGGGINVNKQIGLNKNDDNKSVTTTEITNLTLDSLDEISKYNLDGLKQIAKRLSIPLTIKDDNTRRNLKKDELFEKVKFFLTNKHENLN